MLTVDLARYLAPPLRWIVPLIRPRRPAIRARVLDLAAAMAAEKGDGLAFAEPLDDRPCANFHTGGTTGLPKVARHRASGILYNGWCGHSYIFTERDVLMCPLPLFHVFAAYPILMSCLMSGAAMVMPTPQGYRGEGVMDNFWKLIARHRVTFLIAVPTAVSALMQRKVDADVSTLNFALSGSAAMPVELFHRFEAATGVKVMEGYGLTEATCLVAVNPPFGERRIGSVGLPFPYTDVRILHCAADGTVIRECATDEVGEICVRNPGVHADVYTDPARNRGLVVEELPAHRRPRPPRRRRLSLDHRAGEGPHHPRRPQHRPGPDRGGDDAASGRRLRRRRRPARRPRRGNCPASMSSSSPGPRRRPRR